ncbi:FAD/NAD(P)-binding domain-containing protein [Durotheca rogersii]|uniref:FAD/NAD(P)-binding domain-containing protein n=1 Tax=Durotheca rogersii TaxID=419775 RepID=UPI00221E6DE0|nr:FAD/NAD(P)-binding domain-containing protein [Durotheca rogersii]KAI5865978.1 FAD/NAD(P)-binding domain-containing protein [Durotheca rogersii]
MAPNGHTASDGRKRVLVVGAGAAGMSTAYHLSQHPDKFDVTLIDAADYCGGQAFSIPLDESCHGASWCNQGVQGGSYVFHHTLTMFHRQGFRADPVNLQVSFGKGDTFWTNVYPTQLLVHHQKQVRRLPMVLKAMRWFELFFAILPLRFVLKLFGFSKDFINTVALPMTALFLGTGNATPEVPAVMFERLCTSPTYGMWYELDKNTVLSSRPPMVAFPNLSQFYDTWRGDLERRGVSIRLSTELIEIVRRNKHGVVVRLQTGTVVPDGRSQSGGDPDSPISEEVYDEIVLCCLADAAKKVLGREATWREKTVLGSAKFSDDVTITHTDAEYMERHYENFYREDLAVAEINGVDYAPRLEYATEHFCPMYYIKSYEEDGSKLEMSFDTTNYQSQFPDRMPFQQHVFQTIYLNKTRDRKLWKKDDIRRDKIIREDWWHQLCHTYTHYLFVVPWMRFLQARNHTRFAASWTLVNAHEVAMVSGIAAAVDLGAEYPEDLENDGFAFLCFRLYYLLAYGKWYRRRFTGDQRGSATPAAREGYGWGTGVSGSVYEGPGVSTAEGETWREERESGASTNDLANARRRTTHQSA